MFEKYGKGMIIITTGRNMNWYNLGKQFYNSCQNV